MAAGLKAESDLLVPKAGKCSNTPEVVVLDHDLGQVCE